MTLREIQQPIKDRYREEPDAARITLRATGATLDGAMSCSIDIGRALYAAEAHPGVGGAGSAACSGDLVLGALAACAQLTCQMVAANMGLEELAVSVTVEGDLDLRERSARRRFRLVSRRFGSTSPSAVRSSRTDSSG